MGLILPSRFTRQPQSGIRLDRSNPITSGADFVFRLVRDNKILGPALPTAVNGPTESATPAGLGTAFSSTAVVTLPGLLPIPDGQSYTYLVVFSRTSNSAIGQLIQADDAQRAFQIRSEAGGAPGFIPFNTGGSPSSAAGVTVPVGQTCCAVFRATNAQADIFQNGALTGTTALTGTLKGQTLISDFGIGNRRDVNPLNGTINLLIRWPRALADSEIAAIGSNPWQLFQAPVRKYFASVGGSGPTYTLPVDAGSFALSGNATGLAATRKITASSGAFTLTGIAAGLRVARRMTAAVGSYSYTGNNVGVIAARRLALGTGSFALTGNAVTLTYSPVATGYTMPAATGAFAAAGGDVGLIVTRRMVASPGVFNLTGADVGLSRHRIMQANAGAFAFTGNPAALRVARTLGAATGSFILTGNDVILSGPVVAPRYARPDDDVSAGAWVPSTGTDLYAMIDESAPDSSDYISTASASTCEVALNPVVDPLTSTGQIVRYQAWSAEGNGLTVRLMQGATTIASWAHAVLPVTPTIFAQALTAAECDSITDYADLRFQFTAV